MAQRKKKPKSRKLGPFKGESFLCDSFHLNTQVHIHLEAPVLACIKAELVAVEAARCVCTAEVALVHRVRHALELVDGQGHGPGLAV